MFLLRIEKSRIPRQIRLVAVLRIGTPGGRGIGLVISLPVGRMMV
jgi:hypothetical protein